MIPRPSSLMFAIAFDLVVAEAAIHHPRGVTAAYMDIGSDKVTGLSGSSL